MCLRVSVCVCFISILQLFICTHTQTRTHTHTHMHTYTHTHSLTLTPDPHPHTYIYIASLKDRLTIPLSLYRRISAVFAAKNSFVWIRVHGVVDSGSGWHPELPGGVRRQAHRVGAHPCYQVSVLYVTGVNSYMTFFFKLIKCERERDKFWESTMVEKQVANNIDGILRLIHNRIKKPSALSICLLWALSNHRHW